MDMTKMIIDVFMKPLYDGDPQGTLLESIRAYEAKITDYKISHPESMDPVGDSGTRDEYTQLYMAVMNGNNSYGLPAEEEKPQAYDYSQTQKLPTVHEFLDSYRMVYETSVRPNNRELTDKAYQELFDVENRTDDLIEAQIIIEKEGLILNTVTADYKELVQDFMEAADPNYEVTSAVTKATLGVYAEAKSLEEIVYMGEVAKATCDDIAVQVKLKVQMMQIFASLIFAWEHSKRKIREGGEGMDKLAQAMLVTRKQMRKYYTFLAEDMGLPFSKMKEIPFCRIMMLNPQGLDELWRIKKVMHPANLEATEYTLFREILSDRTMQDILITPQPYPYYEIPDSNLHPAIDAEYEVLAEELNSEIRYFQRNRRMGGKVSQEELLNNTKTMVMDVADSTDRDGNKSDSGKTKSGAYALSQRISGTENGVRKETGRNMVKGAVKEAAKEAGRGFLRGLFRG